MNDKILEYIPYIYLVSVSLISFFVTVYDKWASKHRPRARIRERTLFLLAVLGGSAVMYLTMGAVRHKTRHLSFMLGLPCILLLQLAAVTAAIYLRNM